MNHGFAGAGYAPLTVKEGVLGKLFRCVGDGVSKTSGRDWIAFGDVSRDLP